MTTNKILSILFAFLLLVGCDYNDKYFDGYDDDIDPTDVKKIEYTLTDDDYEAIAANTTNVAIAAAAGVADELKALSTTKAFSTTLPAATYMPAFIASKWFTADDTSAVKITFNEVLNNPEYITQLRNASIYKVTAADYESVWGEGSTTNFFTPITSAKANIPNILKTALPEAVSGDIVAVDYNESENEPSGAVVAINEDFNFITGSESRVELESWENVITKGTYSWGGRAYGGNGYLNASANNHPDGESEIYMITPQIKVTSGLNLTFEACYGYYKSEGGRLSVLVSSNLTDFTPEAINASTWDNITSSFSIDIPSGNYGTLTLAGSHNLDAYIGQNIYIAFRYDGDSNTGATTTVQVDNIVVKSESTGSGEDIYVATTGLYTYNDTSWSAYSGNGYMVTKADYTSMGLNYDNFSGTQADHYLPNFLNIKFPYAQEGDIIAPTYKYYANSATVVNADEYIFSGTGWEKASSTEPITSQFVMNDGKWNFDPSTVITLSTSKTDPVSLAFYKAIVEYVKKEYPSYVTSYGNNEYYYGASWYNNNFDFRISAWKTYYADGTSDEAIQQMQNERLPESFILALEALYADADLVEGIEVIYTINFFIYDGSTTSGYTIRYLVTDKGKFEYIEDSWEKM